jgi:threonine dehydrogenase-like Zn-dependent dehydrogenase
MGLMNGLVLLDFGALSLVQIERPAIPTDYVEIRVSHTGICGSDIHGFTGENGRRFPGQVMGHESEGVISAIGSDVDSATYPIGQRVTFNPVVIPGGDLEAFHGREQHSPNKFVIGVRADYQAAFADYVVVPARNVVALNSSAPEGAGALVEPLAVAVHAINRANVKLHDRALVVGGGPIGQSLVIALKEKGVRHIVVSEPDPSRRALVERLGAVAIDPINSSESLPEAVKRSFGELANVGFDAVGISATLTPCLEAVELGGTVCLVGMGSPTLEVDAYAISVAERSIIGTFTYSASAFLEAAKIVSENKFGVEHLIGQVVSPREAPEMFTQLAAGRGPAGKVLVSFTTTV